MFSQSHECSESLYSFESSVVPVGVDRSFGSGVCRAGLGPALPQVLSELSSFSPVVPLCLECSQTLTSVVRSPQTGCTPPSDGVRLYHLPLEDVTWGLGDSCSQQMN